MQIARFVHALHSTTRYPLATTADNVSLPANATAGHHTRVLIAHRMSFELSHPLRSELINNLSLSPSHFFLSANLEPLAIFPFFGGTFSRFSFSHSNSPVETLPPQNERSDLKWRMVPELSQKKMMCVEK